ncbi:uncharacterized protein LOC135090350 [Scylla paramamosain]|uniref:uncharacterized protein LOC135090350 n=1 Tax=Scylla paramamosain TaxID=85552 RepID=UPI0030839F57
MERRSVLLLVGVVVVVALAGSVGASCPDGFQLFPHGACVKLFTWGSSQFFPSWDGASEDCKKEGGQLITLDTPEKIQQFSTHIFGLGGSWDGYPFCVGARKTESGWRWLSGAKLSSDSHVWLPSQPAESATHAQLVPMSSHPRHYLTSSIGCRAAACEKKP